MTHSIDFRRHVLSIRKKEKLTIAQTAARFSVGVASISRWEKSIEPKAKREGRPRKLDLKALAQDVKDHPDLYQYERAQKFNVSPKAIWNGLRALGVTYKKSDATSQGLARRSARLPRKNKAI